MRYSVKGGSWGYAEGGRNRRFERNDGWKRSRGVIGERVDGYIDAKNVVYMYIYGYGVLGWMLSKKKDEEEGFILVLRSPVCRAQNLV